MRDDELLRLRAARLARPSVAIADDGTPAVLVRIHDQQYAFPLADVRRAAVVAMVTPVPHAPTVVLGLGVSDGEVRAIFDGRIWAGGPSRTERERIPVLLLGPSSAPLALAVDAHVGSTTLPRALTRTASAPDWLLGLTADGVLVVRVAALLEDPLFSPGNRPIEGVVDDHHEEA